MLHIARKGNMCGMAHFCEGSVNHARHPAFREAPSKAYEVDE